MNSDGYFTKDKPLLMLHGYLSDSNSFILQRRYFESEFNVYAPDLKGFGKNTDMPYPYSLDDYVNEVEEYLYKNGIVKPHVIAHSFGARIAIKLATNCAVFDKIVLTGAAGLKPRRSLRYCIKKITYKALKPFVKKEKLVKFYSSDYNLLSDVMKQSFIKIVNNHLDDEVKKIKNPTLIVYGENDRETPLYMAKKLNKNIKDSKLVIIKNAGHFAFLDNPVKFNWEVKEFLLQ